MYRPTSPNTAKTSVAALLLFSVAFFNLPLQPTSARVYNPNNIFTDENLFSAGSLSQAAIQVFLQRKNSVLTNMTFVDTDGQTRSAAAIIYRIARDYNVSAEFLLTTLEKEQSLLSRTTSTQKALDWATGYSCFNNTCNEKYKGFAQQVEAAADTQRIYRDRRNQFGFKVGQTSLTKDGYAVTPQNQATANLFIYTPYVGASPELGIGGNVGGNRLFWRIWNRYFSPQPYLDGQVLTNGTDYWLVKNNQKQRFASKNIFLADYGEGSAHVVPQDILNAYPDGPAITFANNRVVRTSSGQHYLLVDGTKRPIADEPTALALAGSLHIATDDSAISATTEDALSAYPIGAPVTSANAYPQGKLFKDNNGALWLVQDNIRRPIDTVVAQNRYPGLTAQPMPADAIAFPLGSPVKLKDGTFAQNNGYYYLITNGERMKLQNPDDAFSRFFGPTRKAQAVSISTAVLELHTAGEIIDYVDDTITDPVAVPTPTTPTEAYAATLLAMQPDGVIMTGGQRVPLTITYTNAGTTTWQPGEVWLTMTDRGKTTRVFGTPEKINFTESSVVTGGVATFTTTLAAPVGARGPQGQDFTLWANPANPTKLTTIGKFIIVNAAGVTAEVTKTTIPKTLTQSAKPVTVTVSIKNTSKDEIWLSKKAALEIYAADGSASPFYDKADWIRKEVAAVPMNASKIKPGETGKFTFTLDARKVPKGTHTLKMMLKLLDRGKTVIVGGGDSWTTTVTVK